MTPEQCANILPSVGRCPNVSRYPGGLCRRCYNKSPNRRPREGLDVQLPIVRVTRDTAARVREAAGQGSLSAWIRKAIRRQLEFELERREMFGETTGD